MEDDIDIEEHDVMDNPRIRNMFPDLSIVKIEQLDDAEDIDVEENGVGVEEYQEVEAIDYNPQTYTYEYFETTSENVPNEVYDEDYYDSNDIMLALKPQIDQATLYQEALNSTTSVCLEDWGHRLNTSPCYCHDCEILFPTINALDAHKMTRHSYLVALDIQKNTARKSTVASKYCNHCFKTFPDDTSLIKHLYELLPMNNFPKKTQDVQKSPKRLEFKCQKCKMIFENHSAYKWHRKNDHSDLSNVRVKYQKMKVKLKAKAVKLEPKLMKIEAKDTKMEEKSVILEKKALKERKMFGHPSLVPKHTLFQCNVCHINFISCFSAFKHSRFCKKEASFKKCAICDRKIKNKDVELHKLQHKYSDKIKIYTVYKSIYEKVLLKCPKCLACFDELLFWAHYKDCDNAGSSYCPDCDLNIASARYQGHRQKHKSKKYTKKDFIIVEFHVKEKRLRRKLDPEGVTLYYCDYCGICQYALTLKGHADGTCNKNKHKYYCERCGLCVSYKSKKNHQRLHQRKPFTRANLKVYSLINGKEVSPPCPKMYLCRKCKKNFVSIRKSKQHDCKEKGVTCKICTKKFNVQAYKIHRHYHTEVNEENDIFPELLKKYFSIKQVWNILYKCVSCDTIFVNYDSVVSHSQNHFNNYETLVKNCELCEFQVNESDFLDHENLHKNNQAIQRSDFKVLEFNYEDLLSDKWMVLFNSLPVEIKDQILSKSIFRYTRSLKLTLRTGPTDEIKFFCMNCKRHIEGNSLENHLLTDCRLNSKYTCTICQEIFKNLQQFVKHENGHEKLQKTGIVTFNDSTDKKFNENLHLKVAKGSSVKDKLKTNSIVKDKYIAKDRRSFVIYKCVKCDICVFLRHSVERHNCGMKKLCKICNQYYSNKVYPHHVTFHERRPDINKNTLKVIRFTIVKGKTIFDEAPDEKDKNRKGKPKIIMNKGLRVSENEVKDKSFGKGKDKSIDLGKDLPVSKGKDGSLDVSKDKSFSKANKSLEESKDKPIITKVKEKPLKKDKDLIVTKIKGKSLQKDKIIPFDEEIDESYWVVSLNNLIQPAASKIFQCTCNLHFTTLALIQEHLDLCEKNLEISKEQCSKCNLFFPTDILVSHLCKHHSKDILIEVECIKKNQLYSCQKCKLIFDSIDKFDKHSQSCSVDNVKKCNYCLLKFHKNSVDSHFCSAIGQDATYINKITVLKNDFSFSIVYQCVDCNINYLNRKSLKYHIVECNHESKCQLTSCEECGLQFTSNSSHRHFKIHAKLGKYIIKIEDPINVTHRYIEGINKGTVKIKKRRSSVSPKLETPSKKIKIDDTPIKHSHNTRRSEKVNNSNIDINTSKSDNDMSLNSDVSIEDSLNNSINTFEPISKKLKARILLEKYDNHLYRCTRCDQHYLKYSSLDYHETTFDHRVRPKLFKCDVCGLDFSKYTLPRHRYVHHQHMKLKREDIVIITAENAEKYITKDIDEEKVKVKDNKDIFEEKVVKDIIENDSVSKKVVLKKKLSENSTDTTENLHNTNYYKCTDCNVCFLTKKLCYTHTKNHEILDPKMYIQCKICDFQFLIDSLKDHMDSHHKVDFKIENLTVVEYKPLGNDLEPKIDTYKAIDKVQSRLVSSTDGVV